MAIGLDDVMAAETVLSHVDGEAGRLILRGRDLEEVAGHLGFEAMIALLWDGVVPGTPGPDDLTLALGSARVEAFARFRPLMAHLDGLSPIEVVRLLLGAIPDGERSREPLQAVGATAVAAAIAIRRAVVAEPVAPDAARAHAEDLLRMIRGRPGSPEEVRALDTYLVAIIDHGLNASTFAARVVASTAAGLPSAVVAAVAALKGPLHGGAPGPVLDMLDAIGSADNAPAWIAAALDRGERRMGFGHRVYRIRDPRADVLRAALGRLPSKPGRIALAEAVEAAALEALPPPPSRTPAGYQCGILYGTAVGGPGHPPVPIHRPLRRRPGARLGRPYPRAGGERPQPAPGIALYGPWPVQAA